MNKIVSQLKLIFLFVSSAFLSACGADHAAPLVDLPKTPKISVPDTQPKSLVALLPQQGDFASAGQTIKEGINNAYQQANVVQTVKLTILDTESYSTPAQAYQAAQDERADLVLGPLTKPAVNALSLQAALPVKTLALNQADPNAVAPLNLFQFSLSPQADAQQVAVKMLQSNLQKVMVIAPSGDWGQGIASSFGQAYLASQGQIVDSLSYDPNLDVTADIQKILQAHPSETLQNTGVFLVLSAQNVAKILPAVKQLKLPIYTLSMIDDGSNEAQLEGLHFAASPLMLDAQNPVRMAYVKAHPTASMQDINFYGFGVDAFLLAQYELKTGGFEGLAMQGNSGYLTIDTNGSIQRGLTWITVLNGKLTPDVPSTGV